MTSQVGTHFNLAKSSGSKYQDLGLFGAGGLTGKLAL